MPQPSTPKPPSLAALQTAMANKLARMLDVDAELRDAAVEIGLIDRDWLDHPGEHKLSTTPPLEVTRRLLERSVERRPSALGSLGLKAIDMLAWDVSWNRSPDSVADTTAEVTVVFTDLEGFTRYTADNGDAAALDLLGEHHRSVMPIVRSWNGRVVKKLGDGLMIVFPKPADGTRAAIELAQTTAGPLTVRAGANTGFAVITSDDVLGHVVNVAARVTDEATGGQALVTEAVCAAVGGNDALEFEGPITSTLRGIDEPVALFAARSRK